MSNISLLTAALLLSSLPAHAGMFDNASKPEMKSGPVELHPYLKLSEMYDSNIFLQPRSGVKGNNANGNSAGPVLGSWIHTVNAGLKAGLTLSEMHRLDLGYDMAYKAYKKDPRSNNTVNQTADAMYTYKGPMGITGHLKDSYLNTVDPATSELAGGERKRRWQNTAGLDVEYAPEGGALMFGVDGNETVHKYVTKDAALRALNRYEQLIGFKAGYHVMPKTRVFAAYHRQVVHYTNHPAVPTSNSKSHMLEGGIEGDIAPKLTGQIQSGLQYRKYDDTPIGKNDRSKITRNWVVSTKLVYRPLERTKVDLMLSRSLQESTFQGNPFYIATAAGLNVMHKFPWKVTAGVNAAVEQDKYPQTVPVSLGAAPSIGTIRVNRRDEIYQTGGNLDYDIQEWLKVGVSYLYRVRFSHNLSDQYNYRDHQTGMSVGVMF